MPDGADVANCEVANCEVANSCERRGSFCWRKSDEYFGFNSAPTVYTWA
jgi:hypothetical protein